MSNPFNVKEVTTSKEYYLYRRFGEGPDNKSYNSSHKTPQDAEKFAKDRKFDWFTITEIKSVIIEKDVVTVSTTFND